MLMAYVSLTDESRDEEGKSSTEYLLHQTEESRYNSVLQSERPARCRRRTCIVRGASGNRDQYPRSHCAFPRRNSQASRKCSQARGDTDWRLWWGLYVRWLVPQSVRLHSLPLKGARPRKTLPCRGKVAQRRRSPHLLRTGGTGARSRENALSHPKLPSRITRDGFDGRIQEGPKPCRTGHILPKKTQKMSRIPG